MHDMSDPTVHATLTTQINKVIKTTAYLAKLAIVYDKTCRSSISIRYCTVVFHKTLFIMRDEQ